jgi:hypothetical protein
MSEYFVRFLVGGVVLSAFSMLGDIRRPKSFAGLFEAAPSVALRRSASNVPARRPLRVQQTWTMTAGAIALAIYSFFVCRLLVRAHMRAMPATLLLFVVWLVVAFGLLSVAGGQT